MKNHIPLILLASFLTGKEVPHSKFYSDIHPSKTTALIESEMIYDAKQRESARAEADFWKRNYTESVRSQRVWEQKQREIDTEVGKL